MQPASSAQGAAHNASPETSDKRTNKPGVDEAQGVTDPGAGAPPPPSRPVAPRGGRPPPPLAPPAPGPRPLCAEVPGVPGEEGDRHGLRAALAGVPAGSAGGAELRVTRFALHQLRGLQAHLLQLAHGLAGGRRAPSPTGVQEHLWGARQEGRVRPRRQRGSRAGPRGHPRARVRFTRPRAGPTAPTGRGWLTADLI